MKELRSSAIRKYALAAAVLLIQLCSPIPAFASEETLQLVCEQYSHECSFLCHEHNELARDAEACRMSIWCSWDLVALIEKERFRKLKELADCERRARQFFEIEVSPERFSDVSAN